MARENQHWKYCVTSQISQTLSRAQCPFTDSRVSIIEHRPADLEVEGLRVQDWLEVSYLLETRRNWKIPQHRWLENTEGILATKVTT